MKRFHIFLTLAILAAVSMGISMSSAQIGTSSNPNPYAEVADSAFWADDFSGAVPVVDTVAVSDEDEHSKYENNNATHDTVTNVKAAFLMLDKDVLDLIPMSTRLDMLDYYDSGIKKFVTNGMEGLSRLDSVSDNYMDICLARSSRLQIAMLPSSDKHNDHIFLTLYTVGDENHAADTQLHFYDQYLQTIPNDKFIKLPDMADFLNIRRQPKEVKQNIENIITFPTFKYTIDPTFWTLTATLTIDKYLTQEDYALVKPYIIPEVKYHWDGKKFKLIK